MVLLGHDTRIIVQGITGREATFHTSRCIEYGTQIVAGVTPGKGGSTWERMVPVYDSVDRAARDSGATVSLIFVPARYASDAIMEAADAGIKIIVCISEHMPVLDEVLWHRYLDGRDVTVIGPNCPGIISPPARCKVGIMPGGIHTPARIGVVSRSGTLTYEVVAQITECGMGQSTCIGIGGDPLPGMDFVDSLRLFQDDKDTDAIALVGEIGGRTEQDAASFIRDSMTKPVVAFVAGSSAPPGRRMGHAGAIVAGTLSTAESKKRALADAGATVVDSPAEIGATLRTVLGRRGLL